MSFANYLENKVLDHVFGGTSYSAPGTIYAALFTATPGEGDTGTEISTSGSAYGRQTIAFTVSGNSATNTSAVEWSQATSNWGTITHVGIYDASTSGNLMAYAALTASKTVNNGDVIRINASQLTITLD